MNARRLLCICLAVSLYSPLVRAADKILIHGHIYTGNAKAGWAQALAITGTRIEAVGTDQEILSRKSAHTEIIDLQGRTVIPGISDSHTHMWLGALELHGFNLWVPGASISPEDPEKLIAIIKDFAATHSKDKILIGRADFSTTPPTMPTHELLDRAVSDRPVIVHNTTEHALWLNARALALAGITDEPVPNPEEEKYIVRDAFGHPSGVLLEAAQEVLERALENQFSPEEKLAMVRDAAHFLNTFGITSVVNASGSLAEIELYAALRDRGELTVRTRTSFGAIGANHHLTPKFLSDLEIARIRYDDDFVSANLVKFFADGGTGPMSPLTYTAAEYRNLVLELDKRGYQIMTHTTRTDTSELVVETYEAAAKLNGPRDRRFRIEHGWLLPVSYETRVAKLAAIISLQPSFCCEENGSNYDPKDHTPTDRWQSLEKEGIRLAFGSDWPCTWPPDPFVGIREAVTRQVWRAPTGGYFDGPEQGDTMATNDFYNAEERLTVQQAVDAYTQGSAYARFSEDKLGTIEVGKEADLAVLSQDIFSVKPEEISKTKVVTTMVAGKIVYEREN